LAVDPPMPHIATLVAPAGSGPVRQKICYERFWTTPGGSMIRKTEVRFSGTIMLKKERWGFAILGDVNADAG